MKQRWKSTSGPGPFIPTVAGAFAYVLSISGPELGSLKSPGLFQKNIYHLLAMSR